MMKNIYSERLYGENEVGFDENIGVLVADFQDSFTDPRFSMVAVKKSYVRFSQIH